MSDCADFWQKLPGSFKNEVIGFLDLKSRFYLAACSKSDRDSVQKCACNFSSVKISFVLDEIHVMVCDGPKTEPKQKVLFTQPTCFSPETIRCSKDPDFTFKANASIPCGNFLLMSMIQNPNSKISKLEVTVSMSTQREEAQRLKLLEQLFEKSPLYLNIECLEFTVLSSNVDDTIFNKIWKSMNPDTIEKFKYSSIGPVLDYKSLIVTEQWRRLKEFVCEDYFPNKDKKSVLDIDVFEKNLEKITVNFEVFSIEQFWRLVLMYCDPDKPPGSFFQINSAVNCPLPISFYQSPAPLSSRMETPTRHRLLFPTKNHETVLLVKIAQTYNGTAFRGHVMPRGWNEEYMDEVFNATYFPEPMHAFYVTDNNGKESSEAEYLRKEDECLKCCCFSFIVFSECLSGILR